MNPVPRAAALAAACLLGLSLLPPNAGAQSAFRLGVQGGLNFATLHGADAGDLELSTTWSLGATGWLGGGSLSLMPGVILARRGAIESGPGFSSTLTLTHIQVPALVRLRLSEASIDGSIGTFLYAGPALGLKVGCSISATAGSNSDSASCDEVAGDDPDAARFSSSEVSGVVGFGAQIGAVSVALQYELGLSRIAEELDLKTRTVSAVARYFWGGPRTSRTLIPRMP